MLMAVVTVQMHRVWLGNVRIAELEEVQDGQSRGNVIRVEGPA
jgi:hypothetical protein